jgi:DNA-binding FadR family transcriptional regulator
MGDASGLEIEGIGVASGESPSGGLTNSPLRETTGLLSDQVADSIEQDILFGRLAEGEYLPSESDVCDLFGVSRSVVRDALRTLSARDLIDIRAGQRTRVRPPTDETLSRAVLGRLARSDHSLRDVMEGRALLEEALVPLAASRSTLAQRQAVRDAFTQFDEAVGRGEWTHALAADFRFHRALLDAVNQEALNLMLRPLHMVTFVCARPVVVESAEAYNVEGHQRIADALFAQDEPLLRTAVVDHFAYVRSREYREYGSQPFRDAPNVRWLVGRGRAGVTEMPPGPESIDPG